MKRARTALLASGVVLVAAAALVVPSVSYSMSPYSEVTVLDNRRLDVRWIGGSCDTYWHVGVDEQNATVEIWIRTLVVARACGDAGVPRSEIVEFDKPLRSRRVVNSACEDPDIAHRAECRGVG